MVFKEGKPPNMMDFASMSVASLSGFVNSQWRHCRFGAARYGWRNISPPFGSIGEYA
jgi:hypothetical protein